MWAIYLTKAEFHRINEEDEIMEQKHHHLINLKSGVTSLTWQSQKSKKNNMISLKGEKKEKKKSHSMPLLY